ncbi:MAG: Undecaprenyl-diphosphatase [Acidimicrobiales bacterium]|nr:Undecaprenyl-diphosphatase [Acidimicrobiales bacterium]
MRPYRRTSVTVVRLVVCLVVLALLYAVLAATTAGEFSTNFASLLASAPRWMVSAVVSACQLGLLIPAVLGLFSQVVLRHFARVGRMLLAAVVCVAGLVLLSKLVGAATLPLTPRHHRGLTSADLQSVARNRYGIGAAFPTTIDLGVIAAWMFVDRAHWSGRWRRIGLVVLAFGVVARLGVGLADPTTIVTAIAMAAAASLLVQVAFGARDMRPGPGSVARALRGLGYEVASIEEFGGFRGFAGFRAQLEDGSAFFVKIVSRDSWTSLLPVRIYHAARFRDVGQDRPFRSLRSAVEHEALCALKAHADGIPTVRLVALAELQPDAMLMAFEARSRRPLSALDPSERPAELLRPIWDIVAALQRTHTVHRRLNADCLWIDGEGRVVLVEFATASLGVVGAELATDVAEVLAATAAVTGAARAVEAAVTAVGPAVVAATMPRLQPLALTPRTRAAIKAAGGLDLLREEVERVTGADRVPIAELERIKPRTVLTIVMASLALWTLVPQLVGIGSVWSQLAHANWWWAVAALALSATTYVGAAVALDGALSQRLPLGPNIGVQMATSFVGVAAPGGGLALTARFLQKRGVDTPTAVSAVGVDSVAGFVVHVTLTVLFVSLAGTSGLRTFDLPSLATTGLIAAGVLLVAAASLVIPWSRSLLTTRVLPATKRSLANVGDIARQPSKMLELFGGSVAITIGYILALEVAVSAFGAGPAFTSVALVYLVGSAVSSVAPTPGGIGAVEAALIAGLTSAGMPSTTAVAAVILFRLATFWIPLLPGWGAFVVLQRSGDL